jgi:hypothetical protein
MDGPYVMLRRVPRTQRRVEEGGLDKMTERLWRDSDLVATRFMQNRSNVELCAQTIDGVQEFGIGATMTGILLRRAPTE